MSDQYLSLGEAVYFHVAVNTTTGSAADGASASASVRRCGASADAVPIYTVGASLLSHASYPDGLYEISIGATAVNGFSAGEVYAVFFNLTVGGQTPAGFLGRLRLKPVYSNLKWIADVTAAGASLNAAITRIDDIPQSATARAIVLDALSGFSATVASIVDARLTTFSATANTIATTAIHPANVVSLSGSGTPVLRLRLGATALQDGAISGVASTTARLRTNLRTEDADHWKGRIVTFASGTLAQQATDILSASASGTLSVTALTAAPAAADEFIIS